MMRANLPRARLKCWPMALLLSSAIHKGKRVCALIRRSEETIVFKRLFGRRKEGTEKYPGTEPHDLRMPEVDELPNIEEVFAKARKAAAGEGEQSLGQPGQHAIIVTPGRMLMFRSEERRVGKECR